MKSLKWDQVNAWRVAQHYLSSRLERPEFIKAVMADSGAAVGAGTVGGLAATGTSSSSATVMFTVLVDTPPG